MSTSTKAWLTTDKPKPDLVECYKQQVNYADGMEPAETSRRPLVTDEVAQIQRIVIPIARQGQKGIGALDSDCTSAVTIKAPQQSSIPSGNEALWQIAKMKTNTVQKNRSQRQWEPEMCTYIFDLANKIAILSAPGGAKYKT